GIVVAQRPQVQLLGPSLVRVQHAEKMHQVGRELFLLGKRRVSARAGLVEQVRSLFFRAVLGIAMGKTVIRKPSSQGMEEIVAAFERIEQIAQGGDRASGYA